MGIRQSVNEKRGVSVGVTIALIVLAIGVIAWHFSGGNPRADVRTPGKLFFSDDDGKSFFTESETRIPPFDHNGKQAVGAAVYQTGTSQFIAYLYRYTPQGKERLESSRDASARVLNKIDFMEVKKVGEGEWLKAGSEQAIELQAVKAPGGSSDEVVPAVAK